MISHRSKLLSTSGLALAVTLVLSSCLETQGTRGRHALDVKAEGEAHAPAARSQTFEPEYFEGEVAPEVPAARPEERPSAPSPAHVWVAGHHTRQDGQWAWVSGRWAVPPSAGAVWVPGHWVSHLHGYAWISGAWR